MGRGRTGGGRAVGRLRPPLASTQPTPPDPLSARSFTGQVTVTISASADQQMQALFGRRLTDREIAHISGAVGGATVELDARTNKGLRFLVRHDQLALESGTPGFSVRFARRGVDGKLLLENAYLHLRDDAPTGLGTRIFASQVRAASALGIDRIETFAGGPPGNPGLVGYYAWGRLGYDTSLSGGLQNQAAAAGFSKVRTLHDLFKRPGGADWWKTNGVELDMQFNLHTGSTSRKVLEAYTAAKGISLP